MEAYSKRQEKVSKLLQRDLADIFQKEAQLFMGAIITVTTVRISSDLSYAKVYLSIFAPGKENSTILKGIQSQTPHLRYALGKRIKNQVKKIPEVVFFLDDSLDYIQKIESLI